MGFIYNEPLFVMDTLIVSEMTRKVISKDQEETWKHELNH